MRGSGRCLIDDIDNGIYIVDGIVNGMYLYMKEACDAGGKAASLSGLREGFVWARATAGRTRTHLGSNRQA